MGVAWALGGAFVGGIMELIANFVPALNTIDMWIPLFAMPGFVAGAVFSVVLGIAARRRKFNELSLPQFAAFGAVVGILLGAVAIANGFALHGAPVWLNAALAIGPVSIFTTVAATGTLALARLGEPKSLPADQARVGEGEAL
jgi:hypothetical protein